MTPAKYVKSKGLSSLKEISELTKQSPETLRNWHKSKPELFEIVILGCKAKLNIEG